MAPLTKPSSSALPRSSSVSTRVFPSRCAMPSILIRRWDFAQLANSTTVRSRRHCRTPIAIAITPGMIVIGPHRNRKSGMSYSRTTKKRPKNRAKPPTAKYAIGSRSSRLEVLEGTRRPTNLRYFNPATSESRRRTEENQRRAGGAVASRPAGARGAVEACEAERHERTAHPGAVGDSAADDQRGGEGRSDRGDDHDEFADLCGARLHADELVREADDVSVQGDDGNVHGKEPPDVRVREDRP